MAEWQVAIVKERERREEEKRKQISEVKAKTAIDNTAQKNGSEQPAKPTVAGKYIDFFDED